MGDARYVLADGREAGYDVDAECDEKDCKTGIDRGLGYLCGDTPGGDEYGCGGYFCCEHLFCAPPGVEITGGMCVRCYDAWEVAHSGGVAA